MILTVRRKWPLIQRDGRTFLHYGLPEIFVKLGFGTMLNTTIASLVFVLFCSIFSLSSCRLSLVLSFVVCLLVVARFYPFLFTFGAGAPQSRLAPAMARLL
jgi:hypothetical protein